MMSILIDSFKYLFITKKNLFNIPTLKKLLKEDNDDILCLIKSYVFNAVISNLMAIFFFF